LETLVLGLTWSQSFAWGPVSKIENPWGPIGEIANISFQIKFSVTRCISPESFCNSALIPMKNFVIDMGLKLKIVPDS
jgi:hypothetical protein